MSLEQTGRVLMGVVGATNLGSDVDWEIPLSEQRKTELCHSWAIFSDQEQELY